MKRVVHDPNGWSNMRCRGSTHEGLLRMTHRKGKPTKTEKYLDPSLSLLWLISFPRSLLLSLASSPPLCSSFRSVRINRSHRIRHLSEYSSAMKPRKLRLDLFLLASCPSGSQPMIWHATLAPLWFSAPPPLYITKRCHLLSLSLIFLSCAEI